MRLKHDPTQVGTQLALGQAARLWTLVWILMASCNARPTRRMSFDFSHPLQMIIRPGPNCSPSALTFNPNFSDLIMGWPIGWTDPRQPVTAWSAWLRRMRGALCELPMSAI